MITVIRRYPTLAAFVILLIFSLLLHVRLLPAVADTDSFYHFGHASIYKTSGIFTSAFPWTQYSVMKTYAADLWYGFHILLIPLTLFVNPLSGIYVGAFLTTVVSLLLIYAAFRRLQVRWPLFWTLVVAFITADLLYRLTMLRPHPLSLGLSMLLFAYLVTEKSRRSQLAVFLIAAASAWLHIALIWLPILIIGTVGLIDFAFKRKINWVTLGAFFPGLIAGIILRPNPIGAVKLAYIQVAKLLLEKGGGLPLRFGRELSPFVWENFADQLVPITILIILAMGIFLSSAQVKKLASAWSSLLVSLIFFALTFLVARRSNEVFVGFAVIFVSLVFSHWRPADKKSWLTRAVGLAALIALIYAPFKNLHRFDTYLTNAFDPSHFQAVSAWLKTNSQSEAIVFNTHWDSFGQLFFWNRQNYYINGMDPIFEYAYSPSLYWKTHFYAIDAATAATCGKIRCTSEEVEDTYSVLKNDFHASYILLEKRRNPQLNKYLSIALKFSRVFETDKEVLYKLL